MIIATASGKWKSRSAWKIYSAVRCEYKERKDEADKGLVFFMQIIFILLYRAFSHSNIIKEHGKTGKRFGTQDSPVRTQRKGIYANDTERTSSRKISTN